MTTNSSPLSLSRVSKAWSFCAMSLAGLLKFDQKINHLLMFREPLFWRHFERLFDERHVESVFSGRAPRRSRVRRHHILTVHLRQCRCVNHGINLGNSLGYSIHHFACRLWMQMVLPSGSEMKAMVQTGVGNG